MAPKNCPSKPAEADGVPSELSTTNNASKMPNTDSATTVEIIRMVVTAFQDSHTEPSKASPDSSPDSTSEETSEKKKDTLSVLEDILTGKTSISYNSESVASNSEHLLQELESFMSRDLESFAYKNAEVRKGIELLSQLIKVEYSFSSAIKIAIHEIGDFFQGSLPSLSFYQRTILDYETLLESRKKTATKVNTFKEKRELFTNAISSAQAEIIEISKMIADLENKLNDLKQKRSSLQSIVEKCEQKDQQLEEECKKWVGKCQENLSCLESLKTGFESAQITKIHIIDKFIALRNLLMEARK